MHWARLEGSTPLPWHAPPRLCGEPSAGADRKGEAQGRWAWAHQRWVPGCLSLFTAALALQTPALDSLNDQLRCQSIQPAATGAARQLLQPRDHLCRKVDLKRNQALVSAHGVYRKCASKRFANASVLNHSESIDKLRHRAAICCIQHEGCNRAAVFV